MEKEEFIDEILDLTEVAAQCLDLDNCEDVAIILSLLECYEEAEELPNKRRKREWVKPCRHDREKLGSFPFLMKELRNDELSFYEYIRMDCETFNYILKNIENSIKRQDTILRKSISPAKKLTATLRFLATGESYKSTNFQSRMSQPFLSSAIPEVCEAIWKCFKDKYLKFPTKVSEWETIAENFAIKWQFPHCLGALDGKHIAFKSLRKDGSLFYNYKGTHSIVLMALVDADCRFTYIDVGCNGRTHDAGVLLQSDLMKIIDNAEKQFPPDKVIGNGRKLPYVIVGDDAFPLQKHIMKPYPYHTNVEEKKIFNIRISRARHVVEQAFGILSNRFLIFQKKMNLSAEKVQLITKTCCVLHNLLSRKNDNYLNMPSTTASGGFATDEFDCVNRTEGRQQNTRRSAQTVRKGFEEYFNQEGKLHWQDSKL